MTEIRTIGIIGAGRVGTAVARRAVAAGYEVRVASARPAAETGLLLQFTAPGAVAGDLHRLGGGRRRRGARVLVLATEHHCRPSVDAPIEA